MRLPELKSQNRRALLLILLGLILALILMSLPLYSFNAAVYTKKSSNTFVGDEKYEAALDEVEAAAEEFRAQGFDVQINEAVTERVNSKGETTSLITFTIDQVLSRNLFAFWKTALPAGHVFRAILLCALLSFLGAAFGLLLGKGLHYIIIRALVVEYMSFDARVTALSYCLAFVITIVFTLLTNAAMHRRLAAVDMAESLKSVE